MLSSRIRAAFARKIWFVLLLCAAPLSLAAAPKYLGPNKCISCHDHEKQKDWSAKDSHTKALQQLEDKNAAKYAKAIGLADPYNLKGACVACHATVFNGDANAGVSCETCHGPGSDYVEPHQKKGSYAASLPLGMFDTRGNYAVWAKMCNDCHIMRDQKLIAAGHKSGADFEVGAGSKKIVHWAPAYDFAQLSAAGKAGGKRAAPAPAPAAPPPAKEEAKPTQPAAKPTPAPKPTAAPAPPTAAPARVEKPVPTAAPEKKEARPEPTTAPAAPAAPTRAPTSAPTVVATAAPPRAASPAAGRVPPAASPSVIIEIAATPIPPAPPPPRAAAAPTPAPEATMGAAPARPAATRPPVKPRPRPKPRPKPKPDTTPAPPAATRTPTMLPAPMEPPKRPPH